METKPLLKVSQLYKNFGGVQAIHNLNFELAEGELLGLIGPNGSGKTTAVNLITDFESVDIVDDHTVTVNFAAPVAVTADTLYSPGVGSFTAGEQ